MQRIATNHPRLMKPILRLLAAACMLTVAYAGAGIGSVTTSATGATYVPLATSGVATRVDIMNTSGTALAVRFGGTGDTFQIANNVGYTIVGIKTLSQVEVRRADSSGTQVSFSYVYANND